MNTNTSIPFDGKTSSTEIYSIKIEDVLKRIQDYERSKLLPFKKEVCHAITK